MEIDKQINQFLNSYQTSVILMTANQLGLFDQLTETRTAEEVAATLNLSNKGAERLLNALTALGILIKEKGTFHLPEAWQEYLTTGGSRSMKQWIQLSLDHLPVWNRLPEFIQSGKQIHSVMDMLGGDPQRMRAFIDAMHDKGLKATWLIARELPIGDATRMLDVGGGPGTYALEWAKLHKNLKATIFDIAPVLEAAKDYIKKYGMGDRVDTRPGDFTKDELGSGYDLVLLANVLHMYDPASGQDLVRKAVDALVPGGRIIIHGFCRNEEGTSPLEDSVFDLTIGMLTEAGSSHPVKEKIRWLEDAGISDIRHFRIEAIPTGVITGLKPNP
ncbi:MAG: methyltransferase [Nitrospinaceae bacterium]